LFKERCKLFPRSSLALKEKHEEVNLYKISFSDIKDCASLFKVFGMDRVVQFALVSKERVFSVSDRCDASD
jgi:hypothetical protein